MKRSLTNFEFCRASLEIKQGETTTAKEKKKFKAENKLNPLDLIKAEKVGFRPVFVHLNSLRTWCHADCASCESSVTN